MSFGVNGAGLAVMVAVFAQTGGLTGAEVAVAGGTSAVGQKVLEAVFGDAAVRSLAARAREDLRAAHRPAARGRAGALRRPARRCRARPRHGRRRCAPRWPALAVARRQVRRVRRAAGAELPARLSGLRDALEAADGHLPAGDLAPARAAARQGRRPQALGDATVVALAGATGSGKSTLFNALARRRGVARRACGARRPAPRTAAVWAADGDDRAPLLDWLGVPRRHLVPQPPPGARRARPARPARPRLHPASSTGSRSTGWSSSSTCSSGCWTRRSTPTRPSTTATCAPLAGHAGVLLVVLNQADRLDPAARAACLADLRRLLDSEGLGAVPVLAASARTGEGLPELRAEVERAGRGPAGRRRPARGGRARGRPPGCVGVRGRAGAPVARQRPRRRW